MPRTPEQRQQAAVNNTNRNAFETAFGSDALDMLEHYLQLDQSAKEMAKQLRESYGMTEFPTLHQLNAPSGQSDQEYRYYHQDQKHLLVVECAARYASPLGTSLYGAGSSQYGDILIHELEIAAFFTEIGVTEAYQLAPSIIEGAKDGTNEHYHEFLLRRAVWMLAVSERGQHLSESQLEPHIRETYEHPRRRWIVLLPPHDCEIELSIPDGSAADLRIVTSKRANERGQTGQA